MCWRVKSMTLNFRLFCIFTVTAHTHKLLYADKHIRWQSHTCAFIFSSSYRAYSQQQQQPISLFDFDSYSCCYCSNLVVAAFHVIPRATLPQTRDLLILLLLLFDVYCALSILLCFVVFFFC